MHSVIHFLCSLYTYLKEIISFCIKQNEPIQLFCFSGENQDKKEWVWFYPGVLHAYGNIHFALFCFIAKAIKPITHIALDSSGVICFPKPRWKLPPLGN